MYKLLFILFLFTSCFGQKVQPPELKFQLATNALNPYLKLLGIADENALVIRAFKNMRDNSVAGSYLAILSNGEMHRYGIYNLNGKIEIRNTKVPNNEKQGFIALMQKANELDQSQLNLKEVVADTGSALLDINDADTYALEICKGSKFSEFFSEAPQQYIEAKVKGYGMRIRFLEIYEAVDFSNAIQTNDIEDLKKADTLYVYFKQDDRELKSISTQTGLTEYNFYIDNKEAFVFNEVSNKKEAILQISKKQFRESKGNTIDHDFFLKYGTGALLLKSKTIYIIDESEMTENKVILRRVIMSYPFLKI